MTHTQFQGLVVEFYSRRLLLINPSPAPSTTHNTPSSSDPYSSDNSFDSNVVMVLSVFFCAIICSIGLNAIIRCTLRCSIFVASNSSLVVGPTAPTNNGVNKKALKTFPVISYSAYLNLPGLDSECVICLSEFTQGEQVRLLPKCNHGFHVRCIDKWLSLHSSCPTCRHCLIEETCQKTVPSSQVVASSPPPAHLHLISIPPLKPEGFVRNYRN